MRRCHWLLGIGGVTWGPVSQPCSLWNVAFKLHCRVVYQIDDWLYQTTVHWPMDHCIESFFPRLVLLRVFQCFRNLFDAFTPYLLVQHIAPAVRQSQSATVGLFAWPCSICSKVLHTCGRGYLTVRDCQLEDRLPIGMFWAPQLPFFRRSGFSHSCSWFVYMIMVRSLVAPSWPCPC